MIGSLFVALYTKVTRVAPEKASELATAILDIGERVTHVQTTEALDGLQDELESVLRGVVIGLRDAAPFPATGSTPSSSAMNSCAMKSACAGRA